MLGMGYVISLWHYLSLPYNYFKIYWHDGHLGDQEEDDFSKIYVPSSQEGST